MIEFRTFVNDKLVSLLSVYFSDYADLVFILVVLMWISLSALILHFILHKIVIRLFTKLHFIDRKGSWLNAFTSSRLLNYLILMIQGALVQIQVKAWLEEGSIVVRGVSSVSDLFIMFFGLMSLFSILDAAEKIMNLRSGRFHVPIRGVIQTAKLIFSLLFGLTVLAILLGKSPVILLSGLGALSAILMLVFKDPILGLTAGIQLSINDMLMIGDWLEMPKYNADGEVTDIALTTVKVQNWDKTITTIPTYALISDSFKNWRGMTESGARRIKRSLLINTSSIKFLSESDIDRLKKSNLIFSYLEERTEIIKKENTKLGADMSSLTNGRRLTSIGTFRRYLLSYLRSHPKIRNDKTLMVRQLEIKDKGLPIEIYAFADTTVWDEYESIQSDIFDHIFAVLNEFDLLVHEAPTGGDIRLVAQK